MKKYLLFPLLVGGILTNISDYPKIYNKRELFEEGRENYIQIIEMESNGETDKAKRLINETLDKLRPYSHDETVHTMICYFEAEKGMLLEGDKLREKASKLEEVIKQCEKEFILYEDHEILREIYSELSIVYKDIFLDNGTVEDMNKSLEYNLLAVKAGLNSGRN